MGENILPSVQTRKKESLSFGVELKRNVVEHFNNTVGRGSLRDKLFCDNFLLRPAEMFSSCISVKIEYIIWSYSWLQSNLLSTAIELSQVRRRPKRLVDAV